PKVDRPARQPAPDLPAAPEAIPVTRPSAAVHARPAAPPQQPPPVDRRLTIMELTAKLAFAIIRAEGTINSSARAAIDTQMDSYYGYDPVLLNRARAFCTYYTTAAIDVGQCIEQIRHAFDPAQRVELIRFAAELAATAGNEKATALLDRAARQLEVPLPAKTATPSTPPASKAPTREDHLAALEISSSTPLSAELIRRQYHLLTDRFQPDKVQHMGPEFVALAESKRTAAQAAALALLEPLGEPLEPATPPPQELRHNPDLDDVFGA
ncbi:MAG TPA: TerB family tellurite resistance protein, partial [Gemmataceae bacterium]|nr:TerB family tellurite resistance protein [Gemmataceae bacterium]